MSLYDRFELLGLDRDDGVKTFEAREISTGRPVKVHLFVQAGVPLQAALLKAIERLPEEEAQRIIDRGKHEGTPYLVTDRLVDYPGLSEWVQATSHPSKPAKAPLETAGAWKVQQASPAVAATKVEQPKIDRPKPAPSVNDQFADLFPTGERPVLPDTVLLPRPASKVVAPAPVVSSPPPVPAAKEPGEFTRMFQSPVTASPEAAKPSSPVPLPSISAPPRPSIPAPPPAGPATKEPGEFTRMFQSPVTASPAAPPPASQSPASSDFDRFFEPSSPAGPMPKNLQQPIAPQGNSGAGKVGEFTRMFGKPDLGSAPAAPPAAPVGKGPGDFTRMFQGPGPKAATPAAPPPVAPPPAPQMSAPPPPPVPFAAAPPPPAFAKQSGPGEYTRQFAAPSPLTLGQTAPVPSAPPPAAAPISAPPVAMPAAAMPPMAAPAAPAAPFGAAAAMPSAPAPAAPAKNNLPLIIGIAAIVLVAVVIVIVFALRPK